MWEVRQGRAPWRCIHGPLSGANTKEAAHWREDHPPLLILSVLCLVDQLCLTLCDAMDCSPPGSSAHVASPGKNTRVGCHALLQGIFPTQGWNPGLLPCRQVFTFGNSFRWSKLSTFFFFLSSWITEKNIFWLYLTYSHKTCFPWAVIEEYALVFMRF